MVNEVFKVIKSRNSQQAAHFRGLLRLRKSRVENSAGCHVNLHHLYNKMRTRSRLLLYLVVRIFCDHKCCVCGAHLLLKQNT